MKPIFLTLLGVISVMVADESLMPPAKVPAASPATTSAATDTTTAVQDVQFLTRGPIHEAFAETVQFNPQPGLIVNATPPAPVEELPPENQLKGDHVMWISGYWAWDDDAKNFIWVSGTWRNVPPGRQWVPGYWSRIGDGKFQWTSGYWAASNRDGEACLPAPPPRNLDVGANTAPPSEDSIWIPGNWVWLGDRYAWQPGCWVALHPDWTWVPARYCWTPRGYVYLDGYWDHALDQRGVLFAPVCFTGDVYNQPGYYYTPSIVIDPGLFADCLFVRPYYSHYYFGDYFDSCYLDNGFYACFSWNSRHCGYEPIFAHDRWCHRDDPGWEHHRHGDFDFLRDHADARPPHTWDAMRNLHEHQGIDGHNHQFAGTLADATRNPVHGQQFLTLNQNQRQQLASQNQQARQSLQDRRLTDTHGITASHAPLNNTSRTTLTSPPVGNLQPDHITGNRTPVLQPASRVPNPIVAGPAPLRIGNDRITTGQAAGRNTGTVKQSMPNLTPQRLPAYKPEITRSPAAFTPQHLSQPQIRQTIQPQIRQTFQPQVRQTFQPQVRQTIQPQIRQVSQPQFQAVQQPQVQSFHQSQSGGGRAMNSAPRGR